MTYYCKKCGPQEGLRLRGTRCFFGHGRMTRVDPATVSTGPRRLAKRSPAVSQIPPLSKDGRP